MFRSSPNSSDTSHITPIESEDVEAADVGSVRVIVFDDSDSRVVDDGGDTWKLAINDEIAYSRWGLGELSDWIGPVLTRIGIRSVQNGQEDV